MKFILPLFHTSLFIIAMWGAMLIGWRWEMQVHPVSDARVMLKDQQVLLTGTLSMQWNGSYVLTDKHGHETVFKPDEYGVMSMQIQEPDYKGWRRALPAGVVLLCYFLWVVLPGIRDSSVRAAQNDQNHKESQ